MNRWKYRVQTRQVTVEVERAEPVEGVAPYSGSRRTVIPTTVAFREYASGTVVAKATGPSPKRGGGATMNTYEVEVTVEQMDGSRNTPMAPEWVRQMWEQVS